MHAGQVPDDERLQQRGEEALEEAGGTHAAAIEGRHRGRVGGLGGRGRGGSEEGRRGEGEEEEGEGRVESAEVEQEYRVRL